MGTVQRVLVYVVSSIFICCSFIPTITSAVEVATAKVLISELQTESLTNANEEYIELTNISDQAIDLTDWTVQYRSATGTSWQDKATLSGYIYVEGSMVISTQGYNVDSSTFFWTATGGQLASTGGNIRIIAPGTEVAEDTLAWGTGIYGEGEVASKANKGMSLHRRQLDDVLVDTNINNADFFEDQADPKNHNIAPEPEDIPEEPTITDPVTEEPPIEPELPEQTDPEPETPILPVDETLPIDEVPPVDAPPQTLLPILINELMINPSAPLLDSTDEWIELYNPNDQIFSLSGYKIQTGSSYSYSYIFVDEVIQPFGYITLTSSGTNLTLSNTTGAVRLLDQDGLPYGTGMTYDEPEEGNSYALDENGQWVWTTTPTKEASNVFTEAPILIKQTIKKTSATKTTTVKSATAKKASIAKTSAIKAAKTTKSGVANSTTPFIEEPEQAQKTRPLLLATFVVMAVLYGAYEYREDLSNSLWKARRYLESRRRPGSGL